MDLVDLTNDEEAVLLGWMREIIQTDGEYSDEERAEVIELRKRLGAERFDRAIVAANERFDGRAALKEAAKAITRQQARQAIYDFLEQLAGADELTADEEKPLKWLASWWAITR